MKKILLIVLLTLMIFYVKAQKMYIWCPEQLNSTPITEKARDLEIDVSINDTRLITEKSKNKCTTAELTGSIFQIIKMTYPLSTINNVVGNKTKTESGKIFIEINIRAYYATFTSPMWFAQTDYSLKITDNRNSTSKEYSQDIHKESSFFNVGGLATAKNNLNKTYIEANIELIDFITDMLND